MSLSTNPMEDTDMQMDKRNCEQEPTQPSLSAEGIRFEPTAAKPATTSTETEELKELSSEAGGNLRAEYLANAK